MTKALLATLGLMLAANAASAQQFIDPWYRGGGYDPWFNPYGPVYFPAPARAPTIGFLPNGTRVINPWVRSAYVSPQAIAVNNYLAWQQANIWNPSLYYGGGVYGSYGNYGTYDPFAGVLPVVQREPGRFVGVTPNFAVNTATGTVLRPQTGVAQTNEGTFYRLPGSGSLTPYGAYIAGSGTYLNPITGARYNPATGLIVR